MDLTPFGKELSKNALTISIKYEINDRIVNSFEMSLGSV